MTIDELLDRVDDVLKALIGVASAKRFVERRTGPASTADVSAHVRFRDRHSDDGQLVLAVDEDTAISLVRRISGLDVGAGDPLVADGVAELTNIVAGVAGLDFSLPIATYRRAHAIGQLEDVALDHGVATSSCDVRLDVYLSA
jgi:CheY-specific phosphatase CheX